MTRYREIYRIAQLPVFQNRMFHSEEEAKNCVKGDVVLVQDLETGLIFNQAFRPELMQYDSDYQNEQAVSKVFQEHLKNVGYVVQQHFRDCSLIEVGCGKGYFLELLQELGVEITGLDPTYEG
jgi:2-polyprenyl-3-methyl-5-hydroxy-6-metoxy-1,4-benzoquinol methylase